MGDALSSEILGFGPDARVLLVNADDLGMHPAIDRGILDALDHGIARSTSLMTTCPGSREAIDVLRCRTDITFGVHLTLVRDAPADDWRPLSRNVPSLVDADGGLPQDADAVLRRVRADDVATEFRAQIRAVLDLGLDPTHLDFHRLADAGRPDLFDVAADLAAEHGLALRVWLDPGRERARAAGLPVVDHPFLDSFTLDPETKAEHLAARLHALPPGLTEWAVHPAVDDAGARAADPHGWAVRTSDHAFLTSERAAEIVREEGIVLVDQRALRRVWRDRGGLPT